MEEENKGSETELCYRKSSYELLEKLQDHWRELRENLVTEDLRSQREEKEQAALTGRRENTWRELRAGEQGWETQKGIRKW